jgi:uroporphyrinogen-III synthase
MEKKQLLSLASFDWVLFTSAHGVSFFMETLADLEIDLQSLSSIKIGTVGPKTAEAVRKFGLSVTVIPWEFTSENLGKSFQNIVDKKFLLPCADIAMDTLPNLLKEKGASVVEMPIYKTSFIRRSDKRFEKLLQSDQIAGITFTSPSTVMGFLQRVHISSLVEKALLLPALTIGPVTEKVAKDHGFKNTFVADSYTTEGLVSKIKEIIL